MLLKARLESILSQKKFLENRLHNEFTEPTCVYPSFSTGLHGRASVAFAALPVTRVCQLEPFKPRQTGHGLKLTQKTSWNTRWHVFVEGLANVLKILRLNNHCLCLCFIFQGLNSTSGRLASISFSKIREVKAKLAKLLALLISSLSLISLTRFVRSQMLQPGACLLTKHFPLKTRSVLQSRQTLSTAGLLCTVQVLNFTFLDVPSLLDLKSLLPVESKLHVRDSTAS